MRPSPGLLSGLSEALSRATATYKVGGASKLIRKPLTFQRKLHSVPPAHPAAHPRSHAARSFSWRSAFDGLVKHAYDGVFRSIRSVAIPRPGPYSGQRLSPHSPSPFPSFARAAHTRAPPRPRFGPSPRPVALRSTAHSTGLGAARSFSSSGFGVLDNVVHNAPLALRALSGQVEDGLDGRNWRKVVREIREKKRKDVKGKGAAKDAKVVMKEKADEFALYFGARPSFAAVAAEEAEAEPVTLVLAVDPEVDLPVPSSSADLVEDFPRLITPGLLSSFSTITTAYTSHSHRLQTITNRLSAAGLLDPHICASSGLAVDDAGHRVWRVVFHDELVTRQRLERVVRGEEETVGRGEEGEEIVDHAHWDSKVRRWNRSARNAAARTVLDGEGTWWWLLGGSSSSPAATASVESALPSTFLASPASYASSVASTTSSSDEDSGRYDVDAAYALAIAEEFVLPDPSISLSLPSSPAYSESGFSLAYSAPAPPAPYMQQEWEDWSLHSSSSPLDGSVQSLSFAAPPTELSFSSCGGDAEADLVASVWAEEVRTGGDRQHEEEVRAFLGEVDAERMRRSEWEFTSS
ncbi:hypothetical protein JCM8547_007802 [Rhodosporidiobolus lusitaniae]